MLFRVSLSLLLMTYSVSAQNLRISGEKMRAHVKYLASDELEGRGVGTTGEKLATNYLAAQLQAEGVKPGGENGTYFQGVPLVGVTTSPNATLTATVKGKQETFTFGKEFVG